MRRRIANHATGMTHRRGLIATGLALACVPLLALAQNNPAHKPAPAQTRAASIKTADRGQQVWEQNCSRCHNAPQGFSPHISGTIAMHMRVRASLSEADYRELRKFLNP